MDQMEKDDFVTENPDPSFHGESPLLPSPPQQLLERLFLATPSALSLSTRDTGRFIVVNERFTTLTGYTQQELVGHTAIELRLWRPAQVRERVIDRLNQNHFRHHTEVFLYVRSGDPVTCLCHMTPIEVDGNPCLLTQFTDITPFRQTQDALRESETHYRSLVEVALGSILRFDREGRILFANTAASALLDQLSADILGKTLRELGLMSELCTFWEERLSRIFLDRIPIEEEYLHCKADGVATYAWRLIPEFDEYGNVVSALNTMYDISAFRQTDEERLHNSRLESLAVVAEGVAHEFSNLLTAIMGHVSIARMMVKHQEKIDTILGKSEEASLRARDLIMQLLTFSRGGTPIKATMFIADTIRTAAEQALHGDPRRSEFSIPPDLWHCEIDEGQFRCVIHNVIRSLQQAMLPGGAIFIKAHNLPISNGDAVSQVEVTIQGNGLRVAPENLEQIFDPYSTSHASIGGLGLATAHTIIQNHGGYIRAESLPENEMLFRIFLPALPGHSLKTAQLRGRLLIFDKDEEVQNLAQSIAEGTHLQVIMTAGTQEAVQRFSEAYVTGEPFDFVLLDLDSAGSINALETLAQLRAIDPRLCAIASVQYANTTSGTRPMYPDFSGELTKPYSAHDLLEMLSHLHTD